MWEDDWEGARGQNVGLLAWRLAEPKEEGQNWGTGGVPKPYVAKGTMQMADIKDCEMRQLLWGI